MRAARPLRRLHRLVGETLPGARQLHLGWSGDPRVGMTVLWHTHARDGAWVVELRGPGGARQVAAQPQRAPGISGSLQRAELRELAPGSIHDYRVRPRDPRAQGPEPEWRSFRTAPPDSGAFRAVFLCDVGLAGRADRTTSATEAVLREIASSAPLVYLGGGDYAYANGDERFLDPADGIDRWFEQLEPLFSRAPFLAQYGNHDVELGERHPDWAPRMPHPPGSASGRSYSVDVGPAHVVGLYAPGRAPDGTELRWLAEDLASPAARRAAWRIVFQHAPPYASGRSHPARPEVRALAALFEQGRVDLHLSGHDQSYERTHPLLGRVAALPRESADGCSRYEAGRGVLYAKVSPAGKLSDRGRDFSRFDAPPGPEIARRDDRHHHWAVLDVSANELAVEVRGLGGDESPARSIDRFSLVRKG